MHGKAPTCGSLKVRWFIACAALQSIDELEAVDMVQLARELSIHGRSDYLAAVGKQPNSKTNADEGLDAVEEEGKGSDDAVGSPSKSDAQGSRKVVRIEVIT